MESAVLDYACLIERLSFGADCDLRGTASSTTHIAAGSGHLSDGQTTVIESVLTVIGTTLPQDMVFVSRTLYVVVRPCISITTTKSWSELHSVLIMQESH